MAFKNYNNNNNGPVSTTFSPITFSNPASQVDQTKFSISYFNKLMKVSIAKKLSGGNNDQFANYDNDNAFVVFVSFSKAKILLDLIQKKLLVEPDVHNVCIELKHGLLKVSDGIEFGSDTPCISISSADSSGNVSEVIYQCKKDFYTGAYNYNNGKYSTESFDDLEMDTFVMVLEEYFKASSYAIAASVMEAGMYKRDSQYNLIRSIADKVGASTQNGSGGGYNSKTFLAGDGGGNSGTNMGGGMNGVPREYESASFDDIARSMNPPEDD